MSWAQTIETHCTMKLALSSGSRGKIDSALARFPIFSNKMTGIMMRKCRAAAIPQVGKLFA